ncbi:MAG: DsbA family protein [Mucilaginibacter sp.]|uniref:DsbA family protein n=1 Tax=Mucilaginibacter sp. TaxID=1882438 RepID=UPI00326421C8
MSTDKQPKDYNIDRIIKVAQIVLLVVIVLYVYKLNRRVNKLNQKLANISSQVAPASVVRLNFDKASPQIGADDARVVMTVFSDFECEFCKSFAKEILPKLKTDYIDKGLLKVHFRFLPLEIHQHAFMAAEAAAYVNQQGKFWQMHDFLFNQPLLNNKIVSNWLANNGLDTNKLKTNLQNHTFKNQIDIDIAEATRVGITGTPAIVINGNVTLGSRQYDYFTDLIDKELASANSGS